MAVLAVNNIFVKEYNKTNIRNMKLKLKRKTKHLKKWDARTLTKSLVAPV